MTTHPPTRFDEQPLTKRIRWDDCLLALLVIGTLGLLAIGGCVSAKSPDVVHSQNDVMNAVAKSYAERATPQTSVQVVSTLIWGFTNPAAVLAGRWSRVESATNLLTPRPWPVLASLPDTNAMSVTVTNPYSPQRFFTVDSHDGI